jgi:pimeloyl-ACP methyl ester carboxylesterase
MAESICRAGDVEIAYETFGDPGDPAVLLVMGLGTQMLGWHEELCEEIAGRGFHVIRYDNRDVGRSTVMSDHAVPSIPQLLRRSKKVAGYTLDHLADDAAALLDALGIERAHVVGASMGGMIAQTIAIRHPRRVLSLVSIMSNTGARLSGQPWPKTYPVLLSRSPADRDAFIEHTVRLFTLIGSPGFERDEEDLRRRAGMSFDRGRNPAGVARHLAAIIASGNRTKELRRLSVPTLVIHGTADRLVSPSGGRATARAIRGARLMLIPGMGHDLPRELWPRMVDGIVENAARADARVEAPAATA